MLTIYTNTMRALSYDNTFNNPVEPSSSHALCAILSLPVAILYILYRIINKIKTIITGTVL